MGRLLIAALLIVGATTSASADAPQRRGPFCAERGPLAAKLSSDYQQELTGTGQIGPERVMEIFIARDGRWTVLITEGNGVSCIVAAGEEWDSNNLVYAQGT